ncbi:hypothetical protein BC834DRAFT_858084 [Gloeopeniophorella convolvens]|nr:hypothetical protein BC834DRAFT_858084 [Gloeopeniophorella convolvens]
MQVASHSLSHRAPSTSRTRPRWQEYASIAPSTVRTPSNAYFNTPASSVSSPAPTLFNSTCEPDPLKQLPPHPSASSLPEKKKSAKHTNTSALLGSSMSLVCRIFVQRHARVLIARCGDPGSLTRGS